MEQRQTQSEARMMAFAKKGQALRDLLDQCLADVDTVLEESGYKGACATLDDQMYGPIVAAEQQPY